MQKKYYLCPAILNIIYADDQNAKTPDKHSQRRLYELLCRFEHCYLPPPPLTFIHIMCIYLQAAVCTALRAVSVYGDTASGAGKHIHFAYSLNYSNN